MKAKKRELEVVQSNNLVEAIYDTDLNATEHKIIRYAASKIKDNPKSFPSCTFTVTEFLEAAGLQGNGYHARIIKITDELTRKRIKIATEDKIGWFPWFSGIVYENGLIHITFNELIKSYVLALEREFTRYSYRYIGDMQSGYTIRLFEILKQYAPIGKRTIEIDKLKQMMGIGDKYKQYGHFKSRVIEQAKKELDKKKMLTFEYEEVRKGRKVVELIFYIKLNESKLLNSFKEDSTETKMFIKEAKDLLVKSNFNISEKEIMRWAPYGIELLKETLEEIKHRKISHPVSYISTVLLTKHKQINDGIHFIVAENVNIKKAIIQFITQYTSEEIIPNWWIENKFVDKFTEEGLETEEICELWNNNKEYILKARQL